MKNLKKVLAFTLAIIMLVPGFAFAETNYGNAKNVIMMIPDGMSVEAATTGRWMKDDFKLSFDFMATGLVRTNNANTPIADSAPAATAMATGVKTESPYISTRPTKGGMPGAESFDEKRGDYPLATVLEGAERIGKSTGIVSTSNVQHATPADFSSHNPDRNDYQDLGEQQIYQNMEVVLGAGSKHLKAENRKDGEDLISEIKTLGYDYVTTKDEMLNSKSEKIWGMFAESAMAYDIDRDKNIEPSLAEMTNKALEVLSKNEKGFFLMVEGSEIDWGAHANDPVGVVSEVKAFDKAVQVAVDFANKNKDTVIIIAADHGTGGMTFGNSDIQKGYDKEPLENFTKVLKNAKLTGQGFSKELNEERTNISELFKEIYQITDLTEEEIKSVKEAKDVQNAVGKIVSKRSHIGWTTGGHVGGDVALYCYSTAKDAKILSGTIHNYQIGKYMENLMGLDLEKLSAELYMPAREAFEKVGAKVNFEFNENTNHKVTVTKGNQTIELPISKNYAIVNGQKVDIGGLTIFNGKLFVPKGAVDLIK